MRPGEVSSSLMADRMVRCTGLPCGASYARDERSSVMPWNAIRCRLGRSCLSSGLLAADVDAVGPPHEVGAFLAVARDPTQQSQPGSPHVLATLVVECVGEFFEGGEHPVDFPLQHGVDRKS